MKPILQFSHANGFPAQSYAPILGALSAHFDVRYLPLFGHDSRYPVTDGWPFLVNELITQIEKYPEPVIGVGHSLGGVLTGFAASQRPDLFRCIILLDPPCLNPMKSLLLWSLKKMNRQSWVTFEAQALNRRKHWKDKETALTYFSSRPFFQSFDPKMLEAYVEHGTKLAHDGVHLVFDTGVESKIFSTLPHNYVSFQKSLKVPGSLLYGEGSNVVNWLDRALIRYWTPLEVRSVQGSHLFPFEYPEETLLAIETGIRRCLSVN